MIDLFKAIIEPIIDYVVIPLSAGLAWLVRSHFKNERRLERLEETVMSKDGQPDVVRREHLNKEVQSVTLTFSNQHSEIQREFRSKVENIEDDISEIKEFIKKDQEHKIDLASTLSGIQSELKHLNERKRKYDE